MARMIRNRPWDTTPTKGPWRVWTSQRQSYPNAEANAVMRLRESDGQRMMSLTESIQWMQVGFEQRVWDFADRDWADGLDYDFDYGRKSLVSPAGNMRPN